MINNFTKRITKLLLVIAIFCGFSLQSLAQKVVLQAFWWDYKNDNYPNGWANYLADLAPRLKEMGIDAVWIPPSIKNGNQGNGYSPFDHYDLGDKYQKGFLATRLGTKDELLRVVAILHANGIEVIQDVVLNHVDNAGSADGSGGQDPEAWEDNTTSKYKNFRYVSYRSPAVDETAGNYLARSGRFFKNWQNFHPNPADESTSGDWNAVYWGPDVCYVSGAYGKSSNATYNPAQSSDYMRNNMRNWLVWYKKQVGFDGVRLDAVKHFPDWATEDFLYTLQHNAGWASGSGKMLAVGEYVGGKSQLDQWCNNVNNRAGTFDFSLRDGLYGVVSNGGNFDIGTLPGYQQNNRVFYIDGSYVHRTVPFVNNHDTFRPQLSSTGNYIGWNTNSELAPHIDPFDPRLSAVYAVALAVDGTPQIFFEDLFNIGNTDKRWIHSPKSTTDLPARSDLVNLIWCHQNLRFKDGAYKVRYQAPDHLIIERSGKAIISVNDHWSSWQNNWIQTDFAPGTKLKDYSGANGTSVKTVDSNGWVNINTPPCDGSANLSRRGYAVWAPEGIGTNYSLPTKSTTQEWELADDLGDSHTNSLKQGGQLPSGSTAYRTAGKIFVESGKTITYELYPSNDSYTLDIVLSNSSGTILSSERGTGNLKGTYTPSSTECITLRARNASNSNPAQRVWVKVNYIAPQTVSTLSSASTLSIAEEEQGKDTTSLEKAPENRVTIYPNPIQQGVVTLAIEAAEERNLTIIIYDLAGRSIHQETFAVYAGSNMMRLSPDLKLNKGMYQIVIPAFGQVHKLIVQ
jgi:alpha-amylase